MSDSDEQTLSSTEEPPDRRDPSSRPYLFLVLEAHRPLSPPARFSLADVGEVVIGRGTARHVEVTIERSVRRLTVRVEDRRMSAIHARFGKVLGRWILDEAGSRNGTRVNGVPATRVELDDGDVIELGQTFFLFREAMASAPEDAVVLDATALRPAALGLATLVPALQRALDSLSPIARSTISVIIQGETGTGKEVIARALHQLSGRGGAFVAVNCGALPAALVESELFGHRKGAFSGATEDRSGLVRSADGGTLFLDEIGDLAAPAQVVLLRVLQEREVRPIGGTRPIAVDFRVIAATHRPLARMVASGEFRADLFNRLAGHELTLPYLRARREDFGLLAGAFLARLPPEQAAQIRIRPRAARAMLRYGWPGNVRELEQCMKTAVVLAGESGQVEVEHLSEALQRALEGPAAEDSSRRAELVALLHEHQGNVTTVAKALGKARMQVQRWLKRYTIDPAEFRPRAGR